MHRDLGMRGVWVALATPLDGEGGLDAGALATHASGLLAAGCDGVAPFGTTGEGPSFATAERQAGVEALLCAGIRPDQVVAGIGAASLGDAITLARHALSVGVNRFLMLPPFYFKDVSDDGVYAAFARVLDGIGDDRARLLLYHIPQVSHVPVTTAVIERLLADYPGLVAGIKDSTGDFGHTGALARRFPEISVFCGAEEHLPALLAIGGAGTICGLANAVPRLMTRLRDDAGTPRIDEPLTRISALAAAMSDGQFVPRLKALLAAASGEDRWRRVRPPLSSLSFADETRLVRRVRETAALRDDWPALHSADGVR
jgi:4-hydroxy-tetrahydrodipicolinate synthase